MEHTTRRGLRAKRMPGANYGPTFFVVAECLPSIALAVATLWWFAAASLHGLSTLDALDPLLATPLVVGTLLFLVSGLSWFFSGRLYFACVVFVLRGAVLLVVMALLFLIVLGTCDTGNCVGDPDPASSTVRWSFWAALSLAAFTPIASALLLAQELRAPTPTADR